MSAVTFRSRWPEHGAPGEAIRLRQMHVQLNDPTLVGSLLSFLRSRDCVVEQIGASMLDVWCPPLHRDENGAGPSEPMCRSCGTPVAEALGRLGSLRCHDCRDEGGFETLLAGIYGHADGDGYAANARAELAGYLAAWQVENPGAVASLLD